jgi:hypothetical protein
VGFEVMPPVLLELAGGLLVFASGLENEDIHHADNLITLAKALHELANSVGGEHHGTRICAVTCKERLICDFVKILALSKVQLLHVGSKTSHSPCGTAWNSACLLFVCQVAMPDGTPTRLQMGMHSGEVTSAVIGRLALRYR